MILAPASSKAPVDLSIIGDFGSTAPTVQTRAGFYFYGQRTLGEDKNTEGQDVPVLKWVASAQPKVLTLASMGVTVIWPDDEDGDDFFESFRVTHPVTIENEDGPGSVTVDVIDAIAGKKKGMNKLIGFNYGGGGV